MCNNAMIRFSHFVLSWKWLQRAIASYYEIFVSFVIKGRSFLFQWDGTIIMYTQAELSEVLVWVFKFKRPQPNDKNERAPNLLVLWRGWQSDSLGFWELFKVFGRNNQNEGKGIFLTQKSGQIWTQSRVNYSWPYCFNKFWYLSFEVVSSFCGHEPPRIGDLWVVR